MTKNELQEALEMLEHVLDLKIVRTMLVTFLLEYIDDVDIIKTIEKVLDSRLRKEMSQGGICLQ